MPSDDTTANDDTASQGQSDETETITFRVQRETKNELKRTVARAKAEGVLDLNASRSALLRASVHDIIDDLNERIEAGAEGEGNGAAVTAD